MTLLDKFNAMTADVVTDYINNQQEENLLLEFKTVNRPDLNREDRKNLAKTVSAFANSSGGLIVWGVEARNNAGVDCASAAHAIQPLTVLITALNRHGGAAVSPILEGLRHKALPTKGDSGFAVTIVPESDVGPYMAKLGEDRYYKRSGDSIYLMEHFDLEDMFGRRKKPHLSVFTRVIANRNEVIIGVENTGRGTAKAPFLSFNVPDTFSLSAFGVDGNNNQSLPRLYQSRENWRQPYYGGNANFSIHPNTKYDVAVIEWRGNIQEGGPRGEYRIDYQVGAEDMQLVHSSVTFRFG